MHLQHDNHVGEINSNVPDEDAEPCIVGFGWPVDLIGLMWDTKGFLGWFLDKRATFELVPLTNVVSNSQRCAAFPKLDWSGMNQLEAAFLRPCSELM